jgi:diaminohydroxyphosphoribosylaminopyrimidine deaminase/5-amino-6-(5-phosphoribosylamino)uracil reductase
MPDPHDLARAQGAHDIDAAHMRHALELAERGWARVQPNPMVGAVVVNDGVVAGTGWHDVYGGPHAEVVALEAARGNTQGATLYVTLEPCAHHGKTPPCTDAIIAAGIRRVVFAGEDPNPVAAGGAAVLRGHGIEVDGGVERDSARRLNTVFYHTHEHTSPFVALKLALSLDGRLSEHATSATRITGPVASAEVHRMRAGYDAIMVGIGTAVADDPLLTVREAGLPRVPPARVIVDSELRIPDSSRLLQTVKEAPVIIVAAEDARASRAQQLHDLGAVVVRVPRHVEGKLDVSGVLEGLWEQGIHSVLCEGGSRLAGSLLRADAVHRVTLFYAPLLLGPYAVPAIDGPIRYRLEPPLWSLPEVRPFGPDVRLTYDRTP